MVWLVLHPKYRDNPSCHFILFWTDVTFYINIPTAVDFPKIDIIIKNSEQTLLVEGVQLGIFTFGQYR